MYSAKPNLLCVTSSLKHYLIVVIAFKMGYLLGLFKERTISEARAVEFRMESERSKLMLIMTPKRTNLTNLLLPTTPTLKPHRIRKFKSDLLMFKKQTLLITILMTCLQIGKRAA